MEWEAIGAVGEVVGAIAVVATLFYLSVQIKRSMAVQKAATTESVWAEWRQHQRDTYIGKPENIELYVRGLEDFDGLEAPQKRLFTFILSSEWLFIANVMKQFKYGNMDREDFEGLLMFWFSQIRTPGGAQWWRQSKATFIAHDVAMLESYEADFPSQTNIFDNAKHFDPRND